MSKAPRPAVGIDLGTTYSAIARLDELGRPVTLVNAEGDLVTPSIVLFERGQAVVGKEALKALATDALGIAQCVKREMGHRLFHKQLHGRRYPPEVIQAFILHKLRQDAARQLGEVRQAVITVPAYFDEVRRKATQDAGYMAGLEVLDIINEPTAAAIAFGLAHGLLNREGGYQKPQKVLVYDLGGGTFDVTVMEIDAQRFHALATDGDMHLGGWDWDQRLVDYVAEQFVQAHGVDPRGDDNAAGRLWRECEDAKRTLTARQRAIVGFDYRGHALKVEITRDKFEELTRNLLERTQFTTRQTLQAAGLMWKDIDRVLMVGGSTRMPMVARMLEQLSGKPADGSVAVDEAVAHGAAIHAGVVQAKLRGQPPPLRIRNVNSHSLGVVGTDAATGRRRVATLIPRNTGLPVSAKRIFRTQRAGQETILVQIVEGESASPDDCTPIGKFTVRNLPADLPAQTPVTIRFVYQSNGRLAIHLTLGGGECEVTQEIVRDNGLSKQQLEAWRQYITGEAGSVEPAEDDSQGPQPAEHSAQEGPWT